MAIGIYGATGLIGGGTGALDAIDGDDADGAGTPLANGDIAFVGVPGVFIYFYILNATSGAAEDSPSIIAPDANAGTKRWILTPLYGAVMSTPASGEFRIQDLRKQADGTWKIIYNDVAES